MGLSPPETCIPCLMFWYCILHFYGQLSVVLLRLQYVHLALGIPYIRRPHHLDTSPRYCRYVSEQ
jgi:hypothetical protein